jgi:hypothetical protein
MYALDTPLNAIFGLAVNLWATCFIESWKGKQRMLQFLWGCTESGNSSIDERTGEFKYFSVFNSFTS